MSPLELKERTNHHYIAHARQEAMYRMRQVRFSDGRQRFSFPQIGRYFGMHYTTVIHGVKRTEARKAQRQQASA